MYQCIASVALEHSVFKGQQPNLVAIVCGIDVNQPTKERQTKILTGLD